MIDYIIVFIFEYLSEEENMY